MSGAEYLAPTGIRFPDRPTRSDWLYRLHNPDPQKRPIFHYLCACKDQKGSQSVRTWDKTPSNLYIVKPLRRKVEMEFSR